MSAYRRYVDAISRGSEEQAEATFREAVAEAVRERDVQKQPSFDGTLLDGYETAGDYDGSQQDYVYEKVSVTGKKGYDELQYAIEYFKRAWADGTIETDYTLIKREAAPAVLAAARQVGFAARLFGYVVQVLRPM